MRAETELPCAKRPPHRARELDGAFLLAMLSKPNGHNLPVADMDGKALLLCTTCGALLRACPGDRSTAGLRIMELVAQGMTPESRKPKRRRIAAWWHCKRQRIT